MVKTRRRAGGKKRKTRCWRRRNKTGKRYTVCKGSRGQKSVYKRRTKYARKRLRKRMKGGYSGINVPFSPANFQGPSQPVLPPYGPVNVPVPGITKVHDGEYYYAKNNRVIGAPKSTNSAWGKKSQKGGRKKKKRRRRRKRQSGGSSSTVVNAIPGGGDLRDVYWGMGNKLVNLWDNWNGYGGRMSPSPTIQPIGVSNASSMSPASLPQIYKSAGEAAAAKPYTAYD